MMHIGIHGLFKSKITKKLNTMMEYKKLKEHNIQFLPGEGSSAPSLINHGILNVRFVEKNTKKDSIKSICFILIILMVQSNKERSCKTNGFLKLFSLRRLYQDYRKMTKLLLLKKEMFLMMMICPFIILTSKLRKIYRSKT